MNARFLVAGIMFLSASLFLPAGPGIAAPSPTPKQRTIIDANTDESGFTTEVDKLPSAAGGSGGASGLACTKQGQFQTCVGDYACFTQQQTPANIAKGREDAHLYYPDSAVLPKTPRPKDAEKYALFTQCIHPTKPMIMSTRWITPAQTAVTTAALNAIAHLPFTKPTLHFTPGPTATPAEVSYVNTPTYWWTTNTPTTAISKTAALGVTAHAKPRHLTITPGDTSPTITCTWPTTHTAPTDPCTTTYQKTSLYTGQHTTTLTTGQKVKSYQATATPTWDIWITQNGKTITLPGLPTTQTATPITTTIPIDEIQSIVTGQRK